MSKKTNGSDEYFKDGMDLWDKVVETVKAYSIDRLIVKSATPVKKKPAKKTSSNKKTPPLNKVVKRQSIGARVDLHGMTQEQAFLELSSFISICIRNNNKTALIVTGKGKDSVGVLKRMVPLWLEGSKFKKHIKSIEQASPQQGGAGALYIKFN